MCLLQKIGLDYFKEKIHFFPQDEFTIISETGHQDPRRFSNGFKKQNSDREEEGMWLPPKLENIFSTSL